MTHYLFSQSGCIPGIPGTFAGVRVDVAEDGTYSTTPLAQYPDFEASADAPTVAIPAPAPEESAVEQSGPEHAAEAE